MTDIFELIENPPEFKVDRDFEKQKARIEQRQNLEAGEKGSRRLQSYMDSEKVNFIIDTRTRKIHDKTCDLVKTIPVENIEPSESICIHIKLCKKCRKRQLIRSCSDKVKYIKSAERFFEAAGAEWEDLYNLLVLGKSMILSVSGRHLEIKVKEDVWMLRYDGKLTLLHNNWYFSEYKRCFGEGFHEQKIKGRVTFHKAASVMLDYNWKIHHREYMEWLSDTDEVKPITDKDLELAPENDIEISNDNFNITTAVRLKRFSILFNRYMFVDTKSKNYKNVFKKRKILYRTIFEMYTEEFVYGIVICDIPKWHRKKIFAAMNKIKKKIYREKHGRAYLCGLCMTRHLNKNKIAYTKHL